MLVLGFCGVFRWGGSEPACRQDRPPYTVPGEVRGLYTAITRSSGKRCWWAHPPCETSELEPSTLPRNEKPFEKPIAGADGAVASDFVELVEGETVNFTWRHSGLAPEIRIRLNNH